MRDDVLQPAFCSAAEPYPFDVGSHGRLVSTLSAETQRWFDFGLNWTFGFNQEEGVKCFFRALETDPGCAMAHWGVAYASGPFYNLTWRELGESEAKQITKRAYKHTECARALAKKANEVERGLIEALSCRFQKPHPVPLQEYDRWDGDYAAALRRLSYRFPDDHDVSALLAEALITRTPRRLWDMKTGEPASNSDVLEALKVCEHSIALADKMNDLPHPAIAHMYIHALEMSKEPERAMRSADVLFPLCPDIGHINHMPGHIYVLCGDYAKAKIISEAAIEADNKYAEYAGELDFYLTARCHAIHLMVYTCMFLGQYAPALRAANMLQSLLPRNIIGANERPKLAMTSEGYVGTRLHVLVRFGRWRDILDEPVPDDPDLYPVTIAMAHYARGLAYAFLKMPDHADRECVTFDDSSRRIASDRRVFNNLALTILDVARAMLYGEVEYHKGNFEVAYTYLREAVRRDDALNYHEPWAWMHPPRHALAALLLEQGHITEAEHVYRDDLGMSENVQRCAQHPNNVWALHGLVECLQRRGDVDELPLLSRHLAAAQARTDVPITSSCLCRASTYEHHCCCDSASAAASA
jgi:tetratricopeptide (TPR) repeat protein